MAEIQQKKMTVEEFFEWQSRQDRNYELVDGVPVLPLKSKLTHVGRRHEWMRRNVERALRHGSRETGEVQTGDPAVVTAHGVRRADVVISTSSGTPGTNRAGVICVMEILSPGVLGYETARRLEDFKSVEGVGAILQPDTEAPRIMVFHKSDGRWDCQFRDGLDAVIDLPEIEAALPLSELYRDLTFEAAPF